MQQVPNNDDWPRLVHSANDSFFSNFLEKSFPHIISPRQLRDKKFPVVRSVSFPFTGRFPKRKLFSKIKPDSNQAERGRSSSPLLSSFLQRFFGKFVALTGLVTFRRLDLLSLQKIYHGSLSLPSLPFFPKLRPLLVIGGGGAFSRLSIIPSLSLRPSRP